MKAWSNRTSLHISGMLLNDFDICGFRHYLDGKHCMQPTTILLSVTDKENNKKTYKHARTQFFYGGMKEKIGQNTFTCKHPQNVKCGYFWAYWILKISGTDMNFHYWRLLKSQYLLSCPTSIHPRLGSKTFCQLLLCIIIHEYRLGRGHSCYWCNHRGRWCHYCWRLRLKCRLQRTHHIRPFQRCRQHYRSFMQLNLREAEGKYISVMFMKLFPYRVKSSFTF